MRFAATTLAVLLFSATVLASTPLSDLGTGTYLNQYQGGLYENGQNAVPADHDAAGRTIAATITPLNSAGSPNPSGKIVLLSIGMSNTAQEFCDKITTSTIGAACSTWGFSGQAAADSSVNHATLAVVNGAMGSQDAAQWDSANDPDYDLVKNNALTPRGLTEAQVQVIWLKEANMLPTVSLASHTAQNPADAYLLQTSLGNIVRAAKQRYPNLKIVFLSSRTYAGYATVNLNPEPYAYESGFAVKWLVQAQIDQMRSGSIVDTRAGNLDYESGSAPWIAWGPYLWTDGLNARSDGLTWRTMDVDPADGTHPSPACPGSCPANNMPTGESKVGLLLLQHFKNSPYTSTWFLSSTPSDTTPPQATITSPTMNQVLPAGTTQWTLAVTTDEPATCKHHSSDTTYALMSNNFNGGAVGTDFSALQINLQNGQTKNKYVRCQDLAGNAMTTSAHVQYSIANTPTQTCGNNIQEGTETCDLGSGNGACPSACSTTCTTQNCPPPPKTGDLNNDGIVNIVDVQRIVNKLGQPNVTTGEDLNTDGTVNIYDLMVLAQNWG